MEGKVIVLVTDRDDNKHGEVSILDDMKKAERLLETLLEAGFEQDRIRVFTGGEMNLKITHRPVVALVNEGEAESREGPPHDASAPATEAENEPEGAAAEGSGVRFSSLFRSS